MKIALAQLNYRIGDFDANTLKIIGAVKKARDEKADLIIFSELAICGYPPDDFLDYNYFIKKCNSVLDQIIKASKGVSIIVGGPAENKNPKGRRLYNAAFYISDGKLLNTVFKTLLPTYDVFSEARYFQVNEVFEPVNVLGWKAAITICEDLWDEMDFFSYEEDPLKNIADKNPDIVFNISASPFNRSKRNEREDILRNQVLNYKLPLIYVNQVGAHTDIIFDGSSVVFNKKGELVLRLPSFEETIAYVDFEEGDIVGLEPLDKGVETGIEEIYKALVFGIKEYFTKSGFTKAVLGSSGGIDSAVVKCLAVEALGKENVLAVLMPSEFSSEGSVHDAIKLSGNLEVEYYTLPIADAFDAFRSILEPVFKDLLFGLAEENMQARCRAVLLMRISNKLGHILLNTSNKSEMAVGYSTLYGDMCGGLSVMGDVYKMEVYALAKYINRNEEIIPSEIMEKAPSAELRPDQKDSDSLPEYTL
ncbi:MAG: NAD+ synthase, partial [Bacteroidia bacterium]|nr:NAD+ synthase [Bacteroidia bacterium]